MIERRMTTELGLSVTPGDIWRSDECKPQNHNLFYFSIIPSAPSQSRSEPTGPGE